MIRIALCILVFLSIQACTAQKSLKVDDKAEKQTKQTEKQESKKQEPKETEAKADATDVEDPYAFVKTKGTDLSSHFSKIKVKDTNGKAHSLSDYGSKDKDTMIVFVKKGCVFCNALLATMGGKSFPTELLIMTDEKHSDFEEFQEKSKEYKNIKATWLYDHENKFKSEFGFSGFPTFLAFDKDQKVLVNQVGLIMVDDPQTLREVEFPIALKLLSENSVEWMQKNKWKE